MFKYPLLAAFLALVACAAEKEAPTADALPKVQLALNWFPEAEHGGLYAAAVHGYYEENGVEVEILGGGPDSPVVQRVATDAVAFGIVNADDILYARAQQIPVVALMASYQINPHCIIVHESSGIDSISQIKNITLALSQRPAFSHYLRWKYPFEGVTIVPYPGNVTQFLADENFAQQGYVFSEPFVAKTKGGDPKALLVADTGFNPYASVLITTAERIAAEPELVGAVVGASVKGWETYLAEPEATNRHINSLNPEMGMDILAYGAAESIAMVLDPVAQQNGLGSMTLQRWQELLEQMVTVGLIKEDVVDPTAVFTNRFLP